MTSVLVVDDDAMFAKAVGADLGDQGFDVAIVNDVEAALQKLSAGAYDVLLTDLRLGARDGIDLLSALRDAAPSTRAVLMSGYATARDYHRAIDLGAVRVLCKPFTPSELIQCIRQAVECSNGFSGSVHGLSLIDMLQMFNFARRSVSVAVAGRRTGRLHLREGQLVHAEHDTLRGEDAVRSILAMPAGTLSTTALAASVPMTVTRDFREVILDALRAMDEAVSVRASVELPADAEADFGGLLDSRPPRVDAAQNSAHEDVIQRAKQIEGYIASCLVLVANGAVVSFDGSVDLRPAAPITAEVLRSRQRSMEAGGHFDETEEVLVTSTSQYHLIRRLDTEIPAFVYLVLDRARANPSLAKLALSRAVRCA